jgi:acyl-CoA oxidase
LKHLGSEEQQRKFLLPASMLNIIGCYAQTELGHGSNVAGLETTATLDLKTDEFVIHTPNIKATKFWPGTLGIFATHAVVFARLITNGNDHGVKAFIVPIRSLEDHKPLPGISVGDLGSKLSYNFVDNGWLSFDHFRIPRENILSRFIDVKQDGTVEAKGDPRTSYQIMIKTRMVLCLVAGVSLI